MGRFREFLPLMEMADWAVFQQVPPELAFLQGDVDLGFENLGLTLQQQQTLITAFQGKGVAVPGTTHKLRKLPNRTLAIVEPATGQEPVLPADWKQGLYTLTGNTFTYVGKKVRRNDQLPPNFEPATDPNYKDVGDGHVKI
ncbi:MAG: hypothetical protein JO112_19280 [Planctomycetes bacterium]|nr:hypothetical protein [Planctomycetota bacterium]